MKTITQSQLIDSVEHNFISFGKRYSCTPDQVSAVFTHVTKSHKINGGTYRTFIIFILENIFRGHDLISFSNGKVLCAYKIAFHANVLLNRSHNLLICAHNVIFRRNDLIKCAHDVFIRARMHRLV